MKQLTDNMIKNAFDELAVDNKYFDKFKEVVERSYSEQQRDYPNDDEDESTMCLRKRKDTAILGLILMPEIVVVG